MPLANKLPNVAFKTTSYLRNGFVQYVYTDRVREVCHRTGLVDVLRSADRIVAEHLPAPNVEITVQGTTCTFYVDSVKEYDVWWDLYFESPSNLGGEMPVLDELSRNIRPADTFWDVGANVGIYSCVASTRIDSGSVIAIEPNPANVDRIRTNLGLNETSGTIYQLALSSTPGELEFHASETAGSYGSMYREWGDDSITVESLSGDVFRTRENVPSPTVMKMDVAGAEYDALRGLENTLSEGTCRLIYCNVFSYIDNGIPDEDVHDLLREYGYTVERMWDWPATENAAPGELGHYVRARK